MIQNEWSCGQFKLEANNSMVSVVRGASKFLHLVVQRLPIDTHISKLTNGYPYHTSFPKFPTCLIMPLLKTPSQNPMPVLVQLIKWNRHLDILTFRLPIHGLTKLHRGSWDFRCILLISITWVLPKHWQQWKMKVNRVPCTKMNRLSIFNCRFFFFASPQNSSNSAYCKNDIMLSANLTTCALVTRKCKYLYPSLDSETNLDIAGETFMSHWDTREDT